MYAVYKDAESRVKVDLENESVDMRELQQRTTVKAGQMVAKIKFREPAKPNIDVFGNKTIPESKEKFAVKTGEGSKSARDKSTLPPKMGCCFTDI